LKIKLVILCTKNY